MIYIITYLLKMKLSLKVTHLFLMRRLGMILEHSQNSLSCHLLLHGTNPTEKQAEEGGLDIEA